LIPIFGTSAVLVAPPAPLISSGYVAGNTLVAQHYNYQFNHLTKELVNVLVAGNIVQNATVDNQLLLSILALAGQGYLALNAGSPYTLSLSNPLYGTIDVTTGGSQFIINLPSAVTAYAIGYEADFRKADSGAGKLTLQLTNSADYLANVLNGTWDVTEQFGHVKIRAVQVAGVYGYQVQSCDGTVYRNVTTSTQTQATPGTTWWNLGGSLALAPGVYEMSISGQIGANIAANLSATLSTGTTTESDIDMTKGVTATIGNYEEFYQKKRIVVAAAGTYYLNAKTNAGTSLYLQAGAGVGNIIIEAKRVA
jgi:hypothetical protein